MTLNRLGRTESSYPGILSRRLGEAAPHQLDFLGTLGHLALPKTALFCSARCPGDAILHAYDQAARWRDTGRCVISGFHSPVEKECLRILLRGKQPVILCPARSLENMRLPSDWKEPLADGRLLVLSCFTTAQNRVTTALATRRNEFVAALADEVWFAHITPGGQMESLSRQIVAWRIPLVSSS